MARASGRYRLQIRTVLVLLATAIVAAGAWRLSAGRPEPVASTSPPSISAPTVENTRAAAGAPIAGMVWIPGGEFSMGAPNRRA